MSSNIKVIQNSDGTDDGSAYAGQAAVHLPVVGLVTGQSALAAGLHCPVVLTTRSTPSSIDDCAGREDGTINLEAMLNNCFIWLD